MKGEDKLSFPENLARLQAERGETNYRLAKEIDVSQTSIKTGKRACAALTRAKSRSWQITSALPWTRC